MNYTLGSFFKTGERNFNNFFIGQLQPTVYKYRSPVRVVLQSEIKLYLTEIH